MKDRRCTTIDNDRLYTKKNNEPAINNVNNELIITAVEAVKGSIPTHIDE